MDSTEAVVHSERVKTALRHAPVAAVVTMINATVMAWVLLASERDSRVYAWLAIAIAVASARLALSIRYRQSSAPPARDGFWAAVSVGGAVAAGLVWGGGSLLLFPSSPTGQVLWVFLVGGMCSGAASLHYPHFPTAAAFLLSAGLPLAALFAWQDLPHGRVFALMVLVFLAALVATCRRSSGQFGEMIRGRVELDRRTAELRASNARLQAEMAEHQATEMSLRHAQKMEAIGQLTGGIAHDFNNLLTVVLGNLDLLRKRIVPGDIPSVRLLTNAVKGAERGATLTNRLLAFGRRQALLPQTVDLPGLLRGMTALLRSSLGERIRLVLRFPPDLPPVTVDVSQLELALLNLAVNARDAMPSGGEVIIGGRVAEPRSGDHPAFSQSQFAVGSRFVVLSVADSGEGMDAATLASAMDPFFTTKGVGKGTGLGLSMVQGFAVQSGGDLVLHSTKGLGTTAELWLPQAAPETAAAVAEMPEAKPVSPARPSTVLVVDDDPLVLTSASAMLEDLGHRAIEATSGPEALEVVRRERAIDLVITDYAMPGMTGLALADRLHQQHPELPIVLATGYAEVQGIAKFGLSRLSKPFDQNQLARAVEQHVGLSAKP